MQSPKSDRPIITPLTGFTAFALMQACSVLPLEPPAPKVIGELSARVLHKADYNIDDSETVRSYRQITDDQDYRTELARYSVEVPAEIDFTASSVVALSMGTQPHGGYAVGVSRVEEYEARVVVEVVLTTPGETCVTTEAISHPFEFAEVPSAKMIEFTEVQRVTEC